MSVKHIPVIKPSWKVTLIIGLYILSHIHQVQGVCTPRTAIYLFSAYGN